MSLKSFQQAFQSAILSGESGTSDERMAIYQNSYCERMIVALAQDFPVLYDALGESAFASLIVDYIRTYSSTHYNLRVIGKQLAEFILSRDPDFAPYAELAKLDYLRSCSEFQKRARQQV